MEAAGDEHGYELFYDEPSDAPHASGKGDALLVVGPDGSTRPAADVSPLAAAMSTPLAFRRLHVSPRWRDTAAAAVDHAIE